MKQSNLMDPVGRLGENRKNTKDMVLHQCPITSGQRTEMSQGMFEQLCEHKQEIARKSSFAGELSTRWCKECKGAIVPKELVFTK